MDTPPSPGAGGRLPRVAESAVTDPDLRAVLERAALLSTPRPEWYLTLAHAPEMAVGYAEFWELTHRGGRVEHTTKELMRIAIATLLDCSFCAEQRSTRAVDEGLDETAAASCALPDFRPANPRERAALRYARALVHETDAAAFDDVYAELRGVFTDSEVVELGCFAAVAIGGVILSRSLQVDAPVPTESVLA